MLKSFIDDLISSLGNLINNILPEKFKLRKRQGIRFDDKNEFLEEASAFFAASRQKYAKKKG